MSGKNGAGSLARNGASWRRTELLGSGGGSLIAGKVGYAMACAVAAVLLVVSGYAYKTVSLVQDIGGGISIGTGSSVGAMNILLMGLESRTDFNGNTLSGG